jgi:AcrR family transcriptional regulator
MARPKATTPSTPRTPRTPRTRLPAEEARRRILDAAEVQLVQVGPDGLRLTELAAKLGISHPAILHHFGSREGLIAAVVKRSQRALNEELVAALARPSPDKPRAEALMDILSELYAQRGHARLIAWLILSGFTPRTHRRDEIPPLKQIADAVHAFRSERHPAQAIDYDDTMFGLQLTALALLGEAIFGEAIRLASGMEERPDNSKEFRRRLAKLLSKRDSKGG